MHHTDYAGFGKYWLTTVYLGRVVGFTAWQWEQTSLQIGLDQKMDNRKLDRIVRQIWLSEQHKPFHKVHGRVRSKGTRGILHEL